MLKRILDLIIALPSLLIIAPFLILVAILIKLDSPGPILFIQQRFGLKQKPFNVFKFRTMTHQARDYEVQVYTNNSEITTIGKYLRRYKIDELPQLLNVMNGTMSIVGPRPTLPNIADKFGLDTSIRYNVKPGLTSLAGVSGSIYLSWEDKWWYDEYYINNQTIWLDIQIIFKTILVVLLGEKRFLKNPSR